MLDRQQLDAKLGHLQQGRNRYYTVKGQGQGVLTRCDEDSGDLRPAFEAEDVQP
jgi:hypothetical protein